MKCLKIIDLWEMESNLYHCCTPPYFTNFVNRTALEKMNITFDERSSAWDFFLILQECRFEQMKASEGVTEELKAGDQMAWVRAMNSIPQSGRGNCVGRNRI